MSILMFYLFLLQPFQSGIGSNPPPPSAKTGPGGPGLFLPIDDYIPLFLCIAVALIVIIVNKKIKKISNPL